MDTNETVIYFVEHETAGEPLPLKEQFLFVINNKIEDYTIYGDGIFRFIGLPMRMLRISDKNINYNHYSLNSDTLEDVLRVVKEHLNQNPLLKVKITKMFDTRSRDYG